MKTFLSVLTAVVTSLGTQAFAQSSNTPTRVVNGQKFGAWSVSCEALAVNETTCVLDQKLLRSEDRAFLSQVIGFWSADGTQRYLAARVPVGAYLPAGYALRAEDSDEVLNFTWQTCGRDMCEALLELDQDTMQSLATSEGQIIGSYRPNVQAQPVVFTFSATGLADGFTALQPEPKDDQ
ncbi:hypothetical protein BFP70_04390 [Thioclava sp. SK-1]|uniref:invasion associated locus B family protein n=1 Tax=Thioclava sp. SK-1 TaxID=1889770 RepID=UPI0008268067|nr:invasion associated locus B family protein [Thioclava sp. SK-1]OCX66477.1 hypothetical protein BFP70_04390 [Thioclava sp. SK-1]